MSDGAGSMQSPRLKVGKGHNDDRFMPGAGDHDLLAIVDDGVEASQACDIGAGSSFPPWLERRRLCVVVLDQRGASLPGGGQSPGSCAKRRA